MTADSPMGQFDLTGRKALVTGARRGIGRAIALALAAQRAHVVVHHAAAADERSDAEAVVREIIQSGGAAHRVEADFARPGAGADLVAQATHAVGPIDILVLNASIEILEHYDSISGGHFDQQVAINLRAPLELIQAVLPGMKERGWGRIVTIGSIQQVKPHPEMLVYAGTKAAQMNWVRNLAPGAIWTARNDSRMSDPELRRQAEQRIPAGRLGKPEDLVGAALLLCSEAGSYINGIDLFVDGGMSVS